MGKTWIFVLFGALLTLFAANHGERTMRVRRAEAERNTRPNPVIPVLEEEGPGGHVVLTVDESHAPPPTLLLGERLRFRDLESWRFDPLNPTDAPEALARLDGKNVTVTGFPRFLGEAEHEDLRAVAAFLLLHQTHLEVQGHAHEGLPLPAPSRRFLVRPSVPLVLPHGRCAIVTGRLRVDPHADDGAVLALDGALTLWAGDPPVTVPVVESLKLPAFDFFHLEELQIQESRGLAFTPPPGLLALNGRAVRVEGYVLGRDAGPPASFLLGRAWHDGCCGGTPPDPFNSVAVLPADGAHVPPRWIEEDCWAGTLRIHRDPAVWNEGWIARIEDARRCPPVRALGLLLPLWAEGLLLLLALVPAIVFLLRDRGRSEGEGGENGVPMA